jgi:internalin A
LGGKCFFDDVQNVNLGEDREEFTDAELVQVAALPSLRRLHLSNTHITDAGLHNLHKLRQLQSLGVGKRITDSGVAELAAMTQLLELFLYGPKITDGSLDHLKQMQHLEELGVSNTNITQAAMIELEHTLPHCVVW